MKFNEYKGLDLAQIAADVLGEWDARDTFHKSITTREGHPAFVFYEGPPSANGMPGIHHVMARTIKDVFCRYKTQQGYLVHRKAGWDTHGLPVELGVEKKLGITKEDIGRKISIEEYNRTCREAVMEFTGAWEDLTRKMGYWVNMDDPYITYDNKYIETLWWLLKQLFDKGLLYKGYTIQPYSPAAGTGLSTHELNQPGCYRDVKDTTCTAQFRIIRDAKSEKLFGDAEGPLYFLAWTTTPWTIPSDQAVSLKPGAAYVAVEHEGRAEVMLEDLAPKCCEEFGWEYTPVMVDGKPYVVPAETFHHIHYKQPIFDGVEGVALLADYVGVDDGTGIVHNSPGHGVDDYFACLKEGITDICMPVDDDGKFYTGEEFGTGGPFSGMDTDEANPHIIEFLRERGTLVLEKKITHSYPHCWRCKHPVLFRATDQWFVSMDKTGLREQAGKEVRENVKWYPAHAANRIGAMVEQRPDWCISRQRNWGVPIPSYTCADCGEKVMNDATLDAVIKLFHEKGSDAWFTDAPESYLGEACVCPKCGGHHLKADKDILDVWWDSGVSWKAVCEYRPELEYPADVYLEGSDQHRGWFQSSLLTSVGANGHAPYKAVVSQGFTLDGQGRKMSKSLGNVIDPNKVCDEMGADIIRLWVASVDTSSDVSIDHEILARTSDAYRRFRNTLRFLLSELEGQFEPETDGVAFADLLPLDKLMVARLTQVQAEVDDAYASYEFPRAYRALYDFVVTELSNVYLDALKDRLYCEKPGSLERRSAQTVLAELFSMLMRDLQPILSYTVDEAMAYAPAGCVDHQKYAALLDWYKSPITVDEANEFEGVLEASLELRSAVTKALEDARSAGTFTKSQQVRVKAVVPAEMYALLTGDKAVDLAEFYIVSDVELTQGEELSVAIEAAEGECCDRCWNYRTTVGEYNGHAHICKRCADAL